MICGLDFFFLTKTWDSAHVKLYDHIYTFKRLEEQKGHTLILFYIKQIFSV